MKMDFVDRKSIVKQGRVGSVVKALNLPRMIDQTPKQHNVGFTIFSLICTFYAKCWWSALSKICYNLKH